jgi:type I restriction enzyme M protein
MSEDQKKLLEQQLWNIANTLRGKMNADEFRDYILGFIFYKYLSEKMLRYADIILAEDHLKYCDINEDSAKGKEYIEAIREETLGKLGYFLKPSELFSEVANRGNSDKEGESNFILEDLQKILTNIEQSTMGTESEDDFEKIDIPFSIVYLCLNMGFLKNQLKLNIKLNPVIIIRKVFYYNF